MIGHVVAPARLYRFTDDQSADGSVGRHARVHGYVAKGAIGRDVPGRTVRFLVQKEAPHAGGTADGALSVVYASLETPDLFKDGAEVVVEGVLSGAGPGGVFHADKVLAKCPSKYESADEYGDATETAELTTPE